MTAPQRPRFRGGIASLIAMTFAVVAASCSSGGTSTAPTTAPSTSVANSSTAASAAAYTPPKCDRPVASAPKVRAVKGSTSDYDLTSFDGTTIRIHWFPRQAQGTTTSPTVLMGPGWSLPGDTDTKPSSKPGIQSVETIAGLHDAGYNVLTWDPRGFGKSTGTVTVDSADHEAKDVSRIIDWIARQKGVLLDAPGNPRVGMVGESYGGGIQFVTAATDCRVDVITPTIAWNSLATSLYPVDTYKQGWAKVLVSIATIADLDPHITSANAAASSTGVLDQADRQWFVDRGPDYLLSKIHIPTLIVQGTADNLFPLAQGARNYVALQANGVPLAMTWFCGGHGVCLNPKDPTDYVTGAVKNWLARYLKRDPQAAAVPGFQTTDQNGHVHTFAAFPPPESAAPVFAFADSGTLDLQPEGGSGPVTKVPAGDAIGSVAGAITPAKASKALNVPVQVQGKARLLVGAPDLALGYTCTLDAPATKPTRIFAQLVDDSTGRVLGNQVTPVVTNCDGLLHEASTSLEMVAQQVRPGDKLTLQLVASTVAYAQPQMGGKVDFARIELTIPGAAD